MDETTKKYELILEDILETKINSNDLFNSIDRLRRELNRHNSNNTNNNSKSRQSPNDNDKLKNQPQINGKCFYSEKDINKNFFTYFLNLIHEEANYYLRNRTCQTNQIQNDNNNNNNNNKSEQNVIENANTSNTYRNSNNNNNNKSLNESPILEKSFNSSITKILSPDINHVHKKSPANSNIICQPINNQTCYFPRRSYGTSTSTMATPESINHSTQTIKAKRKHISFATTTSTSTTTNTNSSSTFSPKSFLNSRLDSKPTLFDFLTTQKNANTNSVSNSNNNNGTNTSTTSYNRNNNNCFTNNTVNEQKPLNPTESNNKSSNLKRPIDLNVTFECLKQNDMEKLFLISKLYAELILKNFIETINVELLFIFKLLTLNAIQKDDETTTTTTTNDESKSNEKQIKFLLFKNVQSCIYFSISTLSCLESILKFLKSSILAELKENVYVKLYEKKFNSDSIIFNHHRSSQEEIKSKTRLVIFELKQASFFGENQSNKNNTIYDKTLYLSSKNQIDAFYDILWQWEKNRKLENWNFAEQFGDKIRDLFYFNDNMTNFQFTKLFLDQLVLMCKDDKMLIDNDDEKLEGPEYIKAAYDPLKIKRLNARMSTQRPTYGTTMANSHTKFIGFQEFFKDFIRLSRSPIFYQFLKDRIINEIELIHKDIPPTFEDSSIENTSFDRDHIEDMLLKLRVLGKFLGYLFFSQYEFPTLNSSYLDDIISIRNGCLINLNLKFYIERAIAQKHLILTVPFLVEFLCMMDEYAYLIDSIKETLTLLRLIYFSESMLLKSEHLTTDKLLLVFNIAWLFQLKKISINFDYDSNTSREMAEKLVQDNNSNNNSGSGSSSGSGSGSKRRKIGLDNFSIVSPSLLHFCCPFLEELQTILKKFNTNIKKFEQNLIAGSSTTSLVSIEFVCDLLPKENKYINGQEMTTSLKLEHNNSQIQMQLIGQFLYLNPDCKRLVEYACELALKNYIKFYMETKYLKNLIETINSNWTTSFTSSNSNSSTSCSGSKLKNDDRQLESLEKMAQDSSGIISKIISKNCLDKGMVFFREKINSLIESLVESSSSATTQQHVTTLTKKIAIIKTIDKLKQWIYINLNERKIFEEILSKKVLIMKDLNGSAGASSNGTGTGSGSSTKELKLSNQQQNGNIESDLFKNLFFNQHSLLSKILNNFKYLLLKLTQHSIDIEQIEKVMLETLEYMSMFKSENETNEKFSKWYNININQFASEIYLFYLAANSTSSNREKILNEFSKLINRNNITIDELTTAKKINCSRNVYFLETLKNVMPPK